ncbi:RES family NAD+ phosphorylase [Teredinibacter waterburyi]|jgi:RES domain.|uniref:RES family NAD+ phosphorylase n=1 Tax=Teredinibacter waterburyi TaxID=1500538 RepID=UPI00165F3C75|nr:RES family NAD+ phosphorylase [Teredinibacter waterburyi]
MEDNHPLASLLVPQVGLAWRLVETQETAATRAITRSATEQSRLEELLDASKPRLPDDCRGLSYLFMTPFRYPPLQFGSRFGQCFERGIFYASQEPATAFAETAVYLWLFQSALAKPGPLATINDSRTLFSVKLRTDRGCDLRSDYFQHQYPELDSPSDWSQSQKLGSNLRAAGAEFFWFNSARTSKGTNAAVISPKAFAKREPDSQELWLLRITEEVCWFGHADGRHHEFYHSEFSKAGYLQHPGLQTT